MSDSSVPRPLFEADTSDPSPKSRLSRANDKLDDPSSNKGKKLQQQHPGKNYVPPPARTTDIERDELREQYAAKVVEKARTVEQTPVVSATFPECPGCLSYGPLEGEEGCADCDWKVACKAPLGRESPVASSRRRKAQLDFSKFFRAAHTAIYDAPAPNLYAVRDVAMRVQVICLREGVNAKLFLLYKLVEWFETEWPEKFRLEFLAADWSGFAEVRREIVREHGCFDSQGICDFFNRHDLVERITPLLATVMDNGSGGDREVITTPDQRSKHLYDRSVAKALKGDAAAAVLYRSLRYWCDYYRSVKSDYNLREGCYWRYDTLDALHEQFPYLSRSTIDRKLRKLRKAGYITFQNFNDRTYDKTRWYHARTKDKQGNPIKSGGQIAFEKEEAVSLGNLAQACVLTVIRRRVKENCEAGHPPEVLLGTNDFMFLLPFENRAVRRALSDLLKQPEIGLFQTEPPPGYVEGRGLKRPRDRRLQPKLYSFVRPQAQEPEHVEE